MRSHFDNAQSRTCSGRFANASLARSNGYDMLYSRQWSLLWQSSLCPRYSRCIAFSFYTSGYSRFSRETLIHLKKAHCVKERIHVRFTQVSKAVIPKGSHVIKYGLRRKSVFQVQYSEHATIPKFVASCCFDLLHHYGIFQCVSIL